MTATPTRSNLTNPGDQMLTLQEACHFLRVPEGTQAGTSRTRGSPRCCSS
jgi:hypothetical protein